MTRDDTIRMAREAGIDWHRHWDDEENRLERFAALVAAHEREECAKVCDDQGFIGARPGFAIRARSKPSLTCAKCGVDRMHEACKQPGLTCPLMGEAQ